MSEQYNIECEMQIVNNLSLFYWRIGGGSAKWNILSIVMHLLATNHILAL